MKCNKLFLFVFLATFILYVICSGYRVATSAQEGDFPLKSPLEVEGIKDHEENIPSSIDFKKLPNFPSTGKVLQKRIQTSPRTVLLDTRLRMAVDSYIDARSSMSGEYFKAHILEDFFIPTNPPQLLIPRGSWIRGRVSLVKKPTIFSMAGKTGIHLDNLTTPIGEYAPIDVDLDIQHGVINDQGLLDLQSPRESTDAAETGVIQSIAGGVELITKLLNGSLIALFVQGDSALLAQGQELQLVLQKSIQLH